ncbi:unnamed protein product [Urochloa humidicola]
MQYVVDAPRAAARAGVMPSKPSIAEWYRIRCSNTQCATLQVLCLHNQQDGAALNGRGTSWRVQLQVCSFEDVVSWLASMQIAQKGLSSLFCLTCMESIWQQMFYIIYTRREAPKKNDEKFFML